MRHVCKSVRNRVSLLSRGLRLFLPVHGDTMAARCDYCGAQFPKPRANKRFCSAACKQTGYRLAHSPDCDRSVETFPVRLTSGWMAEILAEEKCLPEWDDRRRDIVEAGLQEFFARLAVRHGLKNADDGEKRNEP